MPDLVISGATFSFSSYKEVKGIIDSILLHEEKGGDRKIHTGITRFDM